MRWRIMVKITTADFYRNREKGDKNERYTFDKRLPEFK